MLTKIVSTLLSAIVAQATAQHMSGAALAAQCNKECISYCAYYYPSTGCFERCECPEFASKSTKEQTMLLKSTLAEPTKQTKGTTTTSSEQLSEQEQTSPMTNTTAPVTDTTQTPTVDVSTQTTTTPGSTNTTSTNNTISDPSTDSTSPAKNSTDTSTTTTTTTNSTTTPTDSTSTTNTTTPITDETPDGNQDNTNTNTTDTTTTGGGEGKVDPAEEESRQTCIATCTLKCKSESAEKKDACIDLCFNQCTASIALYVQEKERPLLRSKSQTLMSLSQQQRSGENLAFASYYDESESRLRMDEYMQMKIEQSVDDSPFCTAGCVAQCGTLAELPRTQATQLVGCFEETCGCRNKMRHEVKSNNDEEELEVMRQYFDLIHNQERVEYLILQQSVVDQVLAIEADNVFLADKSDSTVIKHRLNTEEGINYYENYLGKAKNYEGRNGSVLFWVTHVAIAALITAIVVVVARQVWKRLIMRDSKEAIGRDCQLAILKKQRLERSAISMQ